MLDVTVQSQCDSTYRCVRRPEVHCPCGWDVSQPGTSQRQRATCQQHVQLCTSLRFTVHDVIQLGTSQRQRATCQQHVQLCTSLRFTVHDVIQLGTSQRQRATCQHTCSCVRHSGPLSLWLGRQSAENNPETKSRVPAARAACGTVLRQQASPHVAPFPPFSGGVAVVPSPYDCRHTVTTEGTTLSAVTAINSLVRA